jgi:hypothetical protein
MRAILILGAAAAALVGTATSASASPIAQIRNAAARVVVLPENRSDVKFEFLTVNQSLPIELRTEGDKVIADGGLKHRIHGCNSINFGWNGNDNDHRNVTVHISGVGKVSYDNLPQLVVHVPLDARVETSGAVWGSVGRANSLSLGNAGCGDWTVANVRGQLKLSQAGSGDVRAGTSGDLKVSIAGSGDVATQATAGGADLSIAGSGDVIVASINGPLDASIAGSGDIRVKGGRATTMEASIAGSGDIAFEGTADSMKASIAGSGDITGAHVTGAISKSILGSGSVYANGKELPRGRHHHDDDDDGDDD